jgi:hypothetical protein
MGLLEKYFDWVFSDEESFVDVRRGIYYHGSGNTRSIKGMFKNFDLGDGDTAYLDNKEALALLQDLVKRKKITKEDLIEYKQTRGLLR